MVGTIVWNAEKVGRVFKQYLLEAERNWNKKKPKQNNPQTLNKTNIYLLNNVSIFIHLMHLIKLRASGLDTEKKFLSFQKKQTPRQTTPISVAVPKEKSINILFKFWNIRVPHRIGWWFFTTALSLNISFLLLMCPIMRKKVLCQSLLHSTM